MRLVGARCQRGSRVGVLRIGPGRSSKNVVTPTKQITTQKIVICYVKTIASGIRNLASGISQHSDHQPVLVMGRVE